MPRSLAPDLGTPTSVLCQQAAAVGLSHEALLLHLVSAASVRAGGLPLPPLPEVAAAKEQQAAEGEADAAEAARDAAAGEAGEGQEGAEAGRDWGLLGRLAVLDEAAVQQYIDSEFMFSNWLPPEEATAAAAEQATEDGAAEAEGADAAAAGGEEAGAAGAFEFIDATDEPLLDPVAQLEAEPSVGAPYSPGYDEIREGAAHMGVGDPLADWTASAAAQQQQDGGLEHMHPTKQRVWVLLGGDGARRTQSLQAGLHAYLRWGLCRSAPPAGWVCACCCTPGSAPRPGVAHARSSAWLPPCLAACATTPSCWWRRSCWSPAPLAPGAGQPASQPAGGSFFTRCM